MRQLIIRRCFLVLNIGLVLLCALAACGSTRITPTNPPITNEKTSPALTWTVSNPIDGTTQTYTGNPTIHVMQHIEYSIVFEADDPGGIKQMTLGSSTEWSCSSESGVGQSHSGVGVAKVMNFSPDSNGNVSAHKTMTGQEMPTFTCSGGFNFNAGSDSFLGTGTNFSNNQAQSTLTFMVP